MSSKFLPYLYIFCSTSLAVFLSLGEHIRAQGVSDRSNSGALSASQDPHGGRGPSGGGFGGIRQPVDPGVRDGTVGAGQPLSTVGQTPGAPEYFNAGLERFKETEIVTSSDPNAHTGLGPRFNSNQCASCHSQPAVGGSSPSATVFPHVGMNPETEVFNLAGANNTLPSFITPDGPAREARFVFFMNPDGSLGNKPDGGVHDLFVISGRSDAGNCNIIQPDFAGAVAKNNVIFRIPTPLFGAGLIENIADETIMANMNANSHERQELGIAGHPNRNGNDGTISRFGWKAQNKSLEIFAGEAYNVEMGVSNEMFPNERPSPDEAQDGGLPASCKLNPTPEDTTNFADASTQVPSDVVMFAMFMRLLAPPTPSITTPGGPASVRRGADNFTRIGCALCHTPSLQTGPSSVTPALSQAEANLFSDLLVHNMGRNLADGVSQGTATGDEFRTAPLWGLGQRIFFLHDGRSTDLLDVIRQHFSRGSEANEVIRNFDRLESQQQQDLLNFLRSL
jgi:CxxC motif-containing protein (DUF1111 family)